MLLYVRLHDPIFLLRFSNSMIFNRESKSQSVALANHKDAINQRIHSGRPTMHVTSASRGKRAFAKSICKCLGRGAKVCFQCCALHAYLNVSKVVEWRKWQQIPANPKAKQWSIPVLPPRKGRTAKYFYKTS